ncbi:DUF3243 domain-containing protein [Sporosarcina luteola]|uniref:DUF3243 domain-containing protein n=1 Tax=Sporosarcina luteola TaxID=582850 RepID=UPI00203DB645|nr:DUF3243 domain-containing protein [Sporosarcina luteola]MCM3636997.1 DUF3243 domain-containing protein [Sporosarcina luteola]
MDMKDKVQKELAKIDGEDKGQILENFNHFKQYLAEKVALGENLGLSDEKLAKTTEIVAGYLANHEEPRNREEKVLMELWKSGSEEEQRVFSQMLLKMVKQA